MSIYIDFELADLHFALQGQKEINHEDVFLYEEEREQLQLIGHPRRKLEFIGIRHLRNCMGLNTPIKYALSGKPFMEQSDQFISIAHCPEFYSLAKSTFEIGIDIELLQRDTSHLVDKFSTDEELKLNPKMSLKEWALELWCAKEAVYKLANIPGLSFKNDIRINRRAIVNGQIRLFGSIRKVNQDFEIRVAKTDQLLLAVAF